MAKNLTGKSHPVVSFIIPCYNSGQYLPEALNSISVNAVNYDYEVIIVNDGSTDELTIGLLAQLNLDGFTVLHQENKGPASARNVGVNACKGEYILLLDSDNKIRREFLALGLTAIINDPLIDIVHGKPFFFGDTSSPRFTTGPFDLIKILKTNYIDNCTIVRKSKWQALGGQDENPVIMGHADWEFWIRAGVAGFRFHYIAKELFDYRVLSNSLVAPLMAAGADEHVLGYVYGKHAVTINKYYSDLYNLRGIYQDDMQRPLRSFVKFFVNKYFKG